MVSIHEELTGHADLGSDVSLNYYLILSLQIVVCLPPPPSRTPPVTEYYVTVIIFVYIKYFVSNASAIVFSLCFLIQTF